MHLGTPKNQDIREAVEQSAEQVGAELRVVGKPRRLRPRRAALKPPSLPPSPAHEQANGVLSYATLQPDMLKPAVPGDEEGGEKGEVGAYWGHG